MIAVACSSCAACLGHLQDTLDARLVAGGTLEKCMHELGLTNVCCRRHIVTAIDGDKKVPKNNSSNCEESLFRQQA
jgi:DNA-directed RNA polymerase subunit N (RpoN/RPB10)